MTEYLFDKGDTVEYDSRDGKTTGPVVGRQSFSDGNYYFVGLSNPWLTEILIREDKLKKDEEHLQSRIETFWSKVEPEGDCWIWQGAKSKDGYGGFRFPIKACGNKAHRVSFWLTGNVLIKGMEICHECDNPACVRPSHLWQDTHANNNKDMHRKGRGSNQHKKGTAPMNKKVELAVHIKRQKNSGMSLQEVVADWKNVPSDVIRDIFSNVPLDQIEFS